MSKWALMLLGGPGPPAPLLKPTKQGELWAPQTIIPLHFIPPAYNPHFAAYGLGWRLSDAHGYKEVWHTGGLPGMLTKVTLLPELHLGIVVLTNQESREALMAVSTTLEDHYLGVTGQDRVQEMLGSQQAAAGQTDPALAAVWKQVAAAQQAASKKVDYAANVCRYHDAWLGDVRIFAQGRQLWFKAQRSPRLTGRLLPYSGKTYLVRWRDRSFNADAFAAFTLDAQGRASSLQMKPVSAATDFSYDFQDLDLQRVVETATTK